MVEVLARVRETNPRAFSHFEIKMEEAVILKLIWCGRFHNFAFLRFAKSVTLNAKTDPALLDAFGRWLAKRGEWRFVFEETLKSLEAHPAESVQKLDTEEMVQVGLFWALALELAEEAAIRHPLLGPVVGRLRLHDEDYESGGAFELLLKSILHSIRWPTMDSSLDKFRKKAYDDLRGAFKGLFEKYQNRDRIDIVLELFPSAGPAKALTIDPPGSQISPSEAALNTLASDGDRAYSTVKRDLIDARRRLTVRKLDQVAFEVFKKLRDQKVAETQSGQEQDPPKSLLSTLQAQAVFPMSAIRSANEQVKAAVDWLENASKCPS